MEVLPWPLYVMVFLTLGLLSKASSINNSRSLYRFLIRRCQLLPTEETQDYYKHMVRQGFNQHSDESDEERVQMIIQQAVKDSDWIMKKYKITNTEYVFKAKSN